MRSVYLFPLLAMAALLLLAACDPALNMSGPPQIKRSIDGCQDAVNHLHECCPQFKSFVSCTVTENWLGGGSSDWSSSESGCLRQSDCAAIEKSVTSGKKLCGVTFRDDHCK